MRTTVRWLVLAETEHAQHDGEHDVRGVLQIGTSFYASSCYVISRDRMRSTTR